MTALGAVLNDKEMIEYAINSETSGFKFQMSQSVGDDGIWYEQSMNYHYYALDAHQYTAIFANCAGYDLFHYTTPMQTVPGGKKGLKDMYMGPIHLMMPNFYVPALNDGGEKSLSSNVDYYEIAFAMYPEEKDLLGWGLCTFLANKTRNSLYAMKFGSDLPDWCTNTGPKDSVKSPLKTEYLKASGAAVMRKDGDYLFFENGPHGGTHGHYDKLGLILYTHNTEIIKDYGSLAYELPMHKNYFKRTLSHSAPMLDGVSQTESEGSGPAFVDGSLGDVQLSKLTTDALNDGNKLRRTMVLIEDENDDNDEYPLVLDISEALIQNKSDESNHFFDLITHSDSSQYSLVNSQGSAVSTSKVTAKMGNDVAWQYLTSLQKTDNKNVMKGVWDWGHNVRYQFDRADEWSGMELSQDYVKTGEYSMRWKNHVKTKSVSAKRYMADWTEVENITLSLYNAVKNTENVYFLIYSENSTTLWTDYYYYIIPLNSTGWKYFNLKKSDFKTNNYPIGWDAITGLTFSGSFNNGQCESSDVYFDSIMLWRKDGTEIDALNGLEQHLPKVNSARTTFYDLNAPSNPTSKSHAVNIIRQKAGIPIVQLLRPYTGTNFVSSFTQSGKSFVIKTQTETVTVNLGDSESETPCATVTRNSSKRGTITSYLGCPSINLSENSSNVTVLIFSREDSIVSFQTKGSLPQYNRDSNTVVFDNVKVNGDKEIGVNVTCCSDMDLEASKVFINGKQLIDTGKRDLRQDGCVTRSFKIKLNLNPSVTGSIKVTLGSFFLDSASYTQCSLVLLLICLLILI